MKLITQNNGWGCMIASWAMTLDLSYDDMVHQLGHDGSSLYAGYKVGAHIQECIEVATNMSFACTPIELKPTTEFPAREVAGIFQHVVPGFGWSRWNGHLMMSRGVIECAMRRKGGIVGHALAYDGLTIYNPMGEVFAYSKEACEERGLFTHTLWRVDKRCQSQ